jgi:hypothetical protein
MLQPKTQLNNAFSFPFNKNALLLKEQNKGKPTIKQIMLLHPLYIAFLRFRW